MGDPFFANVMDFTAPYVEVDNTYLVPVNSPIHAVADADRSGVRIGVGLANGTGLYLSRHKARATGERRGQQCNRASRRW